MSISKDICVHFDIEKSKPEDDDRSYTMVDATEIIDINPETEKKLLKRLDWHILPLFCTFYFADFLDRANIGNAVLAGLQQDTGMTSNQLSLVIAAFFITYVIFEVPSNIILKKTNAAKWLSFTMLVWGLSIFISGFLNNFAGLFVSRLIIGAAESGYIPGILYILSQIYTPSEFGLRMSILFTMATLSGIVSGPLAYGVSSIDGHLGFHDWQYLFIIEGAWTIVLSIFSFFYLFDDISKVKWLTQEQKVIQAHRMSHAINCVEDSSSLTIKTFTTILMDLKMWGFASIMFFGNINTTSISVFCPTLIDGFGFTVLQAQLLTAPPAVLTTITVLLGGYLINKYNYRSPLIVTGSLLIALGFMLLLVLNNKWSSYGAIFLIAGSVGFQASAVMTWSAINYPDLTVRAIAVAIVITIGNTGSILASYLFKSTDAPKYVFAIGFNIIVALISAVVSFSMGFLFYRANNKTHKGYIKQVYYC